MDLCGTHGAGRPFGRAAATACSQTGRVGRAQVQLEGTARMMTGLQRQLLEWVSPPVDVAGRQRS